MILHCANRKTVRPTTTLVVTNPHGGDRGAGTSLDGSASLYAGVVADAVEGVEIGADPAGDAALAAQLHDVAAQEGHRCPFGRDEGAVAAVILEKELALLAFDGGVTPGHHLIFNNEAASGLAPDHPDLG